MHTLVIIIRTHVHVCVQGNCIRRDRYKCFRGKVIYKKQIWVWFNLKGAPSEISLSKECTAVIDVERAVF